MSEDRKTLISVQADTQQMGKPRYNTRGNLTEERKNKRVFAMIDRNRWVQKLYKGGDPGWPCPTCKRGSLALVEQSIHYEMTAGSLQDQGHQYWEPSFYEGRFSCLLRCTRLGCKETVAAAGDAHIEEDYDGTKRTYNYVFTPRFLSPSPDLIVIPGGCPAEIQKEVRESFKLFWCDKGSCLNRIRVSVEMVMKEMRIRRFSNKNGKRNRIALHHRIEALRLKAPSLGGLCDQLLAIKWLGNEGSHGEEVDIGTVFNAYDLLESILRQRYDDSHSALTRLTRQINSRRGSV